MARSTPQSCQRYPLTQVLGTEANVRILRELSLHGGQLSAPSLASRTALAKGSVRTGLNVLLALGVISIAGNGHAQLYSLRQDYPLRAAIEMLFEAEQARFDAILEAVRQAARTSDPPLIASYIYGSVARGQDQADSDLDVLIVAQRDEHVSAGTDAMRDALQGPGEHIGFLPSVTGLSLDDVTRHLHDPHSPWKRSLQDVIVVTGKSPASLAKPQPAKQREPAE